ncbi:MAG TPA: hypothetical protein VI197_24145 [Polyangiaceae bacterium]
MTVSGRSVLVATPLALAYFAFAERVVAEPAHWLVVDGACAVSADEVARRVDTELIGSRPAGLRAQVNIEAADAGYRVRLSAARASRKLGDKQLVAPSCDEAVDAAVLVLAIALTEPEPEAPAVELRPAASEPPPSPPPDLVFVAPQRTVPRDAPELAQDESAPSHGRRAGVLFGVETGIAPRPTPYVGASFALPIEAWELWSALRYGLPSEEASVDADSSEEVRREFGAIGLSLCRGLGAAWRFSLCAGGEFGVTRVHRTFREGGAEIDTDEGRVRLAGVGTARFTRQVGGFRPELDFSAAVAPWTTGAAPNAGFRLGAGLALQF